EAGWLHMTRAIPPSLAPVLEQLELEEADLVTTARLDDLVRAAGIRTATRTVAARLRERGWLLPTGQRGVWEFAPAAVAGPYSRGGHTRLLRSVLARSEVACGLTFQAAAWALGLADRAPTRVEVTAVSERDARRLPDGLDVSVFAPRLDYQRAKGVPVLHPASVLVHMATNPTRVRSWSSALEWLPDLVAEVTTDDVLVELGRRPSTVASRSGYLLQGLRPDVAEQIIGPSTKTWFGPRRKVVRHDSRWQVADTLLPFDPRKLESVT
ncbi:type IV toxin-antitoxin system AbiEi family antitoxin, partial [Frankia sp. CiP1_Cm_nod2]|uniref:type IV toxin-antitoxin system AbiEi family antitoxin n=2 Tax=unclassified Frankia TaxID=2632575 RepID=UPI002023CB1B